MLSNITLQNLEEWTFGKLSDPSNASLKICSISTDTRSIKKGDVFAALKGENFDGHEYLEKAASSGALALISEKSVKVSCPVIIVDDTLKALVKIGRALRNKFKGPVFSVTGSAGKSSTRDMIATLLGEKTLRAPSSFNNLLGVSKTIFLLEDSHEKLVLEMGMNAKGEIKELCETFEPNIVLITNIGDAHIGKLGGKEGIYQAKKEMFDYIAKNKAAKGIALNTDDDFVVKAYKESGASHLKTLTYSAEGKKSDICALSKSLDPGTCYLNLKIDISGSKTEISCPIFGLHHAQNIVAAIAAVRLIDTPIEKILSRIPNLRPADHRGHIVNLANGVTCIDESYNSNPSALKSSLDSLSHVNSKRRRLIVIGEMRELEEFSIPLHEECGKYLMKSHSKLPFRLLTVGENAKPLGEAAKALGADVSTCLNYQEALSWVEKSLQPLDVLFVKGSHGVRLDLLVDNLTQSVTKK